MSTLTLNSQPVEALGTANAIRMGRVQIRNQIASKGREGASDLAVLIVDPPSVIARSYVWQIVQWVPRIGDAVAANLLRSCGVDPWRRVGKLTPRQAEALADRLRAYADGGMLVARPRARRERSGFRGPRCSGCGEHMRSASEDGRCGFCLEGESA